MNQSVASDVKISDRLYCYYEPDLTSLMVSRKGSSIGANNINSHKIVDKTSEIEISVSELLPNSTTRVAFNIENTFDPMSLSITILENDGPMTVCSPIMRPSPMLSYTWFNGNKKELPLKVPDRRSAREKLRIQSNGPNDVFKNSNFIFINLMKYLFLLGS